MLEITNLDHETIWKIVKNIRKSFLSEYTDLECNQYNTLLSDYNITYITDIVAEKLQMNTSYSTPNKNVSEKTLQTAAQIFTYLNYCPSYFPKFLLFNINLFQTATSREIVSALSSIMKTSEDEAEKGSTVEQFETIMKMLNLDQYRKIQIITKGKCFTNATFAECTKISSSNDSSQFSGQLCFLSKIKTIQI